MEEQEEQKDAKKQVWKLAKGFFTNSEYELVNDRPSEESLGGGKGALR